MRYWKRVDSKGETTAVESYSHDLDIDGAIEINEKEFNAFIASLPEVEPPRPGPDRLAKMEKRIDDLEGRIDDLETG